MRFLRQTLAIAAKDLRSEIRGKEAVNASVSFALVILLLFSFAFGALNGAGNLIWSTLMQVRVPVGLRGRVASLDWLVSVGLTPVSFALTGPAAAAFGVPTVLIEKHRMGGDCLNTGCVPSKALIRSAKFMSHVKRAREFGIRVALGARSHDVLRLVLGGALKMTGAGVAIGLVAAGMLTRLLGTLLFAVQPLDPVNFVGTAAVLVVSALAACALPAWRAVRVDPAITLRQD